jgi:thioredoxin-related protein
MTPKRAVLSVLVLLPVLLPGVLQAQIRQDTSSREAAPKLNDSMRTAESSGRRQARPEPLQIDWSSSLDEAINHAYSRNKKVLVYIKTEWCGFCKLMEEHALADSAVITYINQKYEAVKLDAMRRRPTSFRGTRFEYDERRHVNELAYLLLNKQMQYPGWVIMNRHAHILSPITGYMQTQDFLKALQYYGDNIYMVTSWEEYEANYQR